jgi:hypothetical protein
MEEYKTLLITSFSNLINKYNKFQLSNHSNETYKKGGEILTDGAGLLKLMKLHIISLETLLCDCQDFITEVEEDLSVDMPSEDFVYATNKGMVSYTGRDYIPREKPITETIKPITTMRKFIPEIGYYIKLNTVCELNEIPPMFYYYNNTQDKINPPGMYCTITPGVHVKIPFATIVDSTKEYSRGRSIRCKYITKTMCDDQRSKMAKYHNSQVRTCNFAHTGDEITKIGYASRCSSVPRFGDSKHLTNDIKSVNISDIKNIMLYGLNDMLAIMIWLDCNKYNDAVFINVEKA